MANDRTTRARTLRLVIHLPLTSLDRAPFVLMLTETTRGIPHSRLQLHGTLTNIDGQPSDAEAVSYVVRAADLLLQQVQR